MVAQGAVFCYNNRMELKKLHLCEGDLPADATFPNGMAAVDTETMGLNIPRDRLCLVQVGDGAGNVWLVKFNGDDYHQATNLKAMLQNPKILKMFHFGRFDIAVMQHYLGVQTAPVYCTKIASKLTRTYSDRHGLKSIVQELLGVELDKEQQTSDWGAPELSEAQKHYAACDVLYLHGLKEVLDEKLKTTDRLHIAQQCFAFLPTRAALDLAGWSTTDIFAHQ